jgi:hypothetical protein
VITEFVARRPVAVGLAVATWCVWVGGTAAADPAASVGVRVEVERGDGGVSGGLLERIDADGVRLAPAAAAGEATAWPIDAVRAVRRAGDATDAPRGLEVTLADGSKLTGDDFLWDGKQPAGLVRPEGRIELPPARVRTISWRGKEVAAAPWQSAIPEGTAADLVVVGTDDRYEFVECAIMAVSADTVTVVLDEETIPVKRSKVIGLHWLRPDGAVAAAARPRAVVAVTGGAVGAGRVEWSAAGLVIDGEIRIPADMLRGVDFAAGRTVSLAGLAVEKVDVEPWFGDLGRKEMLAAFFAPRSVGVAAAAPAMIMRPRTVAVWRLPPESRRFRTVVAAAAGPQSGAGAVVAVRVDDREVFRGQVDGGSAAAGDEGAAGRDAAAFGLPIDVELGAGRRLTLTVDHVPAGMGGAVRFTNPVVER